MAIEKDEDEGLYNDVRSAYMAAEELQDEDDEEQDDEGTAEPESEAKEPQEKLSDAPEAAAEQDQPSAPVELTAEKAPTSWTPASREKWAALDPDIRQEIIRREEASANGVRQLQERFAPAGQFIDQMKPVAHEAQQIGTDPVSYIHSMAMSERTLRTADMPAKFNELVRIADQYGIPLREIIDKSVGQQVMSKPQQQQQMQIPQEIRQELQEIRQWRNEQANNQINDQMYSFAQDKEFFNDVRHVMADLIERGIAPDMQTAYDQACWMMPEVRQVMMTRSGQASASGQVAQRQAKATGASIPASGKVAVSSGDSDDDDIAATVRKAFTAASGRS